MRKIIPLLSIMTLISACTNHSTNAEPSTALDAHTLNTIPYHKNALRACIIEDKNIQSILHVDIQSLGPNYTRLLVNDKNRGFLYCEVDNTSHKVINLTPSDPLDNISAEFYPIGKKISKSCSRQESIRDEENRIMGTICYS